MYISFIILVFLTCDVKSSTRVDRESLDKVYNDCLWFNQICFGFPGSNCLIKKSCALVYTLKETGSEIESTITHDVRSISVNPANLIFGIDMNPFQNSGTAEPVCKKEFSVDDMILRVFQVKRKEEIISIKTPKQRYYIYSAQAHKKHWTSLCPNVIVDEFKNRFNTNRTKKHIVFDETFYFDMFYQRYDTVVDHEHFKTFVGQDFTDLLNISLETFKDFKDPGQYSTTDGQVYLNFNLKDTDPIIRKYEESDSEVSGTSQIQIGGIVYLVSFYLIRWFL